MIETEQKYDVDTGFTLPDLARPPGVTAAPPVTQRLAAIYFDTAGLRLMAARITLRRRTGGTDAGWHIKLPVSADTRRELHFPLGRATRVVPARIAAELAEWTGSEPLRPVARLQTRRTVHRLTGPDGQVLAEVADDLVTGSEPDPADPDRWQQRDRWREVEVELVTGDRDLLAQAGQRLRAAGAQPARSASKLARLLGTG